MEGNFLKLNNIDAYKSDFSLSNYVWEIVMKCGYFEKETIGNQFIRSVDSISANIAEGFGRYSKKDKVRCYRISQGSIKESLDWNEKAKTRNLTNPDEYKTILNGLLNLPKEINQLIKYTNNRLVH
jgi:four helix bundle protein